MKKYRYSYKKNQQIFYSTINALNIPQAKAMLREKKIVPINIKEDSQQNIIKKIFAPRKVALDQIVSFTQLFSGTIAAGLTVKDSLNMLAKQVENPILQNRIADIIVELDGGTPLSQSFSKHTDIFPKFYPMLLKAGEVSGNLAKVLEYIGTYLERMDNLKKEVKGIFTYPIIVTVMAFALLGLILTFVAPTFKSVFGQAKIRLPIPTQILFFLSDAVKHHYIAIIIAIISLFILFRFLKKQPSGQKAIDSVIIKIPLIGPIIKGSIILRFVKTLEILVNNNVPILQALQTVEESTTNLYLRDIVIKMRSDVSKGMPIAGQLFDNPSIIPPIVAYSISMGEKSGRLGQTLIQISLFIDKELYFGIKKLSSRLDPLLTMGLGGMVLFIALSIYLPIFDMIMAAAK